MAGSATIAFSTAVTGLATGTKTVTPTPVVLTTAVADITGDIDLAIGDNTISVPSGATYVVLEFPITAGTITLKGAGGDTGVQLLSNTTMTLFMLLLVSGETSIILNSTAVVENVQANFV